MPRKRKGKQTGWMNWGTLYLRKCKIKDAVCQNEKNKQKENQEKIIKSPSPDRRLVHPAEVKHG